MSENTVPTDVRTDGNLRFHQNSRLPQVILASIVLPNPLGWQPPRASGWRRVPRRGGFNIGSEPRDAAADLWQNHCSVPGLHDYQQQNRGDETIPAAESALGTRMTSHPSVERKSPPPATWRWAVLVVISVAMFGNYYVYDSVAPVADLLQRQLGFSDTQIGTLNAIYSFPNIVMVLIGGIIVDRFGTRLSTLAFALICLVGAVVTAISPVVSGHGARPADLRPRRRVDDRGDHGRDRPVVRRPPAGVRLRREPQHRPRRLVQRGLLDQLVQAALRPGLAAAAVAGRGHGAPGGGRVRLCTT